jgi:hypothetical protein
MAFVYAYSMDGEGTNVIKDYSLDTVANYKTGAGTNDMKKGDLVFLTAGLLRRAIATTGTGTALGVIEGGEFLGLVGQGQPYAATNASFTSVALNTTKNPNGVGKVRADKSSCVYKVPVNQAGAIQTCTNTQVGTTFNIILDAAGNQSVDLNLSTAAHVKVVDYTPDGKSVFVTLV